MNPHSIILHCNKRAISYDYICTHLVHENVNDVNTKERLKTIRVDRNLSVYFVHYFYIWNPRILCTLGHHN